MIDEIEGIFYKVRKQHEFCLVVYIYKTTRKQYVCYGIMVNKYLLHVSTRVQTLSYH